MKNFLSLCIMRMKLRRTIIPIGILLTLFFTQKITLAQTASFEFEGLQRIYEVYLPQNFEPDMPLVISLHGYTETIEWYKTYTLLHEIADTAGFITVYPTAFGKSWNSGLIAPGWTQRVCGSDSLPHTGFP